MPDGSGSRHVNGDRVDSGVASEGRDAAPKYGSWVSLYGFVHRSVERRSTVFGGSVALGSLVLVRQFYSFVSAPSEWSGLPPWTVVGGVLLFGFGVGYYVIRDATSCSECGATFSRERVAKRPVSGESRPDAGSRAYLEAAYECRNCGHRTTELHSHPEWEYPRG